MLGILFENDGSRKEKWLLFLTILVFGLILLAIYLVVEAVKGVNAVHEDLVTSPIRNKGDLTVTTELVTNEKHL